MKENYGQNNEQNKKELGRKQCTVSRKLSELFSNNLEEHIKIFEKVYCKEKKIENVTDKEINDTIATKLGVDLNTVNRWRSGVMFPSMEYLIKLADILNTTVDELLTGKNIYQEYLSSLEKKGFSSASTNAINQEIRATVPKPLFKMPNDKVPLKIDFFTVLNFIIEGKDRFLYGLINDSIQISEAYRRLTDLDKYKTILEEIKKKPLVDIKTDTQYMGQQIYYNESIYNAFKKYLPDEIQAELEDAERDMIQNYNMYKYDYILYLFYELCKNNNIQ